MALNDLSAEYQHSALLIKNRLVALRRELKATTDPEVAWGLKRRIAELTPMLTEMNELAELTARYYERGYYRNEKYSANCFADTFKDPGRETLSHHISDCRERDDGSPAGYVSRVLPRGKDDSADSRRKESQQKHREQKLATSRRKIAPVHPLSGHGASLMDAIMKGKK